MLFERRGQIKIHVYKDWLDPDPCFTRDTSIDPDPCYSGIGVGSGSKVQETGSVPDLLKHLTDTCFWMSER